MRIPTRKGRWHIKSKHEMGRWGWSSKIDFKDCKCHCGKRKSRYSSMMFCFYLAYKEEWLAKKFLEFRDRVLYHKYIVSRVNTNVLYHSLSVQLWVVSRRYCLMLLSSLEINHNIPISIQSHFTFHLKITHCIIHSVWNQNECSTPYRWV